MDPNQELDWKSRQPLSWYLLCIIVVKTYTWISCGGYGSYVYQCVQIKEDNLEVMLIPYWANQIFAGM